VDIPAPGLSSDSILDASHDIYSFFEAVASDNEVLADARGLRGVPQNDNVVTFLDGTRIIEMDRNHNCILERNIKIPSWGLQEAAA
jgi:hypothetical protein